MQIFRKAAGVFKLNYYWLKGLEVVSAVVKELHIATSTHINIF
jgi:hypothetical protein